MSEKLSDFDVTGAVRLAASDAKLIAPTNEVAEVLKAKHPAAPTDRPPAPHLVRYRCQVLKSEQRYNPSLWVHLEA